MKLHNRLASVLSSVMLALNCLGTQSAIAASNEFEKTGMTKLCTCSADELTGEGTLYEIPEGADSQRYYLYYEYENLSRLSITVEIKKTVREYERVGDRYVETKTVQTEQLTIEDQPSRTSGFRYEKFADKDSDLISFRVKLDEPSVLSEGVSVNASIYGYKKSDTPDPSLSEITGTTTGTARVGGYAPDYDPWFTNEPGGMPMNRGTNAYWYSVMRIESYPQRLFALGEKFNTKGLKVILTETRRFNGRDHDISDCLQIWTDYDPDTPGEYLVYIRSDYENGEVSSDDYLFYTVIVDGDLTTGPDGGDGTTWLESLTTPDTTEQETTATDDTTESLQTEETVEAETASETDTTEPGIAALRGDVDCSGNVAIADAVLLARYIAEDPVTVTAQGLVNAELDGEAGLTSGDLAVLLQGIAGIETL